MAFATHPHSLVALFPETLVQLRSELGVRSIDLGNDTSEETTVEVVILTATVGCPKPQVDIVHGLENAPPGREPVGRQG